MSTSRSGADLTRTMAVVGLHGYFAKHAKPKTPQDLAHHQCIKMRLRRRRGDLLVSGEPEPK